MKTLFSFIIAFFALVFAFGQTRTSPVISSTSSGENNTQILWKVVYVNQKTVTLKFMKSIDCAVLTNITANNDGVPVNIIVDKAEFKKLNTETEEEITIKFVDDIIDMKIRFGLVWDLRKCNNIKLTEEVATAKSEKNTKQNARSTTNTSPPKTYSSSDVFYYHVKKTGRLGTEENKKN